VQVLAIAWFSPGLGLPLDDAWIHQVVARTFAETGTLGYAPGQHGAAATSYLWAALLALNLKVLHLEASRWALLLNSAAALATGQLLFTLVDGARPEGVEVKTWRVTACVAALFAFLHLTKLGTALRAVAQNPRGAMVVGIDVEMTHKVAFALSMVLAAIGGAMLGPLFLVFPQMGDLPLVKGLAGIVLGGMGSIPGAVIGGLAIGVIEATSTLILPTDWRDVVIFGTIVAVLILRPSGLFGVKTREEA